MLKRTRLFIFTIVIVLVNLTAQANDWIYNVRPGDNLWN
jgi:hypothetical protein